MLKRVRSTGRRKGSIAEVSFWFQGSSSQDRVKPNNYGFPDSVTINRKPCIEYLQYNPFYLSYLRAPFCLRKGQLCTDKEDMTVKQPLMLCVDSTAPERYLLTHITIEVRGGGLKGQVQAMQLGIARTLLKVIHRAKEVEELSLVGPQGPGRYLTDSHPGNFKNAGLEDTLRTSGFLTRDSRCKERKKYGLKKARKASQYSKR